MDAKQRFFEQQLQLFQSQNPEEGFFDVIFEIEGKKLYADKFRLAAVSTTFRSMLSKKWNSKVEPVEINGNTFEDFKEFITFIYSGECSLSPKNVFVMVDLAQFYKVEVLKNVCEEYLSKIKISNENIFHLLEVANKCSMKILKGNALTYFQQNFTTLTTSENFLFLDGSVIKELIIFAKDAVKAEEMFEAVYKWGEHQAKLKKEVSNHKTFNLNEAIKNELSEFLQYIHFHKMNLHFLHKFVVSKAFIFPSLKELSEILCYFTSTVTVNATGPNGEILQGILPFDDNAVEFVKSLKNSLSKLWNNYNYFYWNKQFDIPTTPSLIKKSEKAEWYLIYFQDKYLGIKHHSIIGSSDYLLAEMICEKKVEKSANWKIEII